MKDIIGLSWNGRRFLVFMIVLMATTVWALSQETSQWRGPNRDGIYPETGEHLWSRRQIQRTGVHANSPIYQNGCICSFSCEFGGVKLELSPNGRRVRDIWNNRYLDAEAGGAVLIDGYLYGCGYESGRTWQCLDWESGELKYSSRDLTKGSIIHADGMLYCYGENGVMALVCLFYFTKTDQAQIIRKLF